MFIKKTLFLYIWEIEKLEKWVKKVKFMQKKVFYDFLKLKKKQIFPIFQTLSQCVARVTKGTGVTKGTTNLMPPSQTFFFNVFNKFS